MPDATFAVSSFHGGEISKAAQGRFDKPDYRFSMKRCLNGFPTEIGNYTRRPGTMYAGHTRAGAAAKVVKFDFQSSDGVTLEFTDGKLRFRQGAVLIDTNDSVAVSAVSAANPAVVTLATAVDWATGDTAMFTDVAPLLQNRQFLITKSDTTHFSLIDALTNETIDGATLGTIGTGTMRRLHELTTSYTGGAWSSVRAVQAETTDILLCATVAPQALVVSELPTDDDYPQFEISDAVFNDGPYLDPFTSGVQATPSAKVGIINLALSFATYDSTKAYREGDFVTTASVNYRSLADQNVNNAPASGAPWWTTASAAEAINDGRGFLGTDIGRLVRLFSEPAAWAVGSTYAAAAVVSYNPTGLPGASQYWSSKAGSNTGHIPGTDLTWWEEAPSNAAIWSWGRITALSNIIDRALAGSASIGNMTSGGGLAASFDGTFSQAASACSEKTDTGTLSSGTFTATVSSYVGKNYSGASDQKIQQATIYPSNDSGFAFGVFTDDGDVVGIAAPTIVFNLRGKSTLPASASDGTLLGTSGSIANTLSAVTVTSSDQTTSWKYVWVEMLTTVTATSRWAYSVTRAIAQLSFFNPPGTGTGSGVTVELLGPALLYTTDIKIWRLGAFSDTTGWPTCGHYYEGRLWLGGAIENRLDACVSNGIEGHVVNFAPTDFTGAVAASNAISYTLNSNSVNKIIDFRPDTPGLIACTSASEFLILAPTTGPIAPTNIAAREVTRIGSEDVPSVRTDHTTVFVKRFGRKLIDYFADANFNKPTGQNIADKAEHLVAAGIEELAYASAATPIIWGRDGDGALFGVTYKRDTLTTSTGPTFAGWHAHELGTGRTVESMCIGPSVNGDLDTLTIVTTDADTNVRHVEVLTDVPAETAVLDDGWYLDDAVVPTSTTTSSVATASAPYGGLTINGLWHLNGETVQVTAGGIDCGDFGNIPAWSSTKTYAQYEPAKGSDGLSYVSQLASNTGNDPTTDDGTNWRADFLVASGSITVPYGDGISAGAGRGLFTAAFVATGVQIVVGKTYTSDGQLVRPITPADSGARNGPAFGKLGRGHRYAVSLINTAVNAIKFGGDLTKKLYPALFKNARGEVLTDPTETFTGIYADTLQDDYGYDNGLAWRISRPLPANIAAIAANLSTQDQ
jgi:hypothetical protein